MRRERLGLVGVVVMFLLGMISSVLERPDGSPDHPRRPDTGQEQQYRRPQVLPGSDVLGPISPQDPAITIAPAEKGNSTGTAFAIGDGVWMTARHVIDGCSAFGVVDGRRAHRGGAARLSPVHDLAVFRTDGRAPVLGFDLSPLRRGQAGFHLGYPQGRPADLRSSLLGRMRVVVPGRRRSQPVIAWAEAVRKPRFQGSLGGMSGGPVLNAAGDVIGVSVAESRRRGRVFTSAPAAVHDMLIEAGVAGSPAGSGAPVSEGGFEATGQALRASRTVSQVICRVR